MVKGSSKKYLTPAFILSHISEYDIYRYYTGIDFKLNRPFSSPLRDDANPSFCISSKFNRLYHIDFADSNIRGNCFDFVMQKYSMGFPCALDRIACDFGLSSTGTLLFKREAPVYKQPKIIKAVTTQIQVVSRNFNNEELRYWNEYYQDISDLKRENVFVPKSLYINKKRVSLNKNELCFGYLYEDKYWKIYWPYAKNKKDKWKSSVPIDLVDGLSSIKACEKVVVTKSKKDKMVLLKVFPCTCSVQNESVVALNENTIKHLKENAKKIYINFDSDPPGITNCTSVTSQNGFEYINVPKYYQKIGIKDYALLAKKLDIQAVKDHFKLKEIIT